MFDGTVPVELKRLKKIYLSLWRLSLGLGAFAADARRAGLPVEVYKRIDSLEEKSDEIRDMFASVLTEDERYELENLKPKRRKPAPRRR